MPLTVDQFPEISDEQYRRVWDTHMSIIRRQGDFSGAELKVLQFILADSLPMNREEATLSLRDFTHGYDDERGWLGASGLSRSGVRLAIASLVERGIITRKQRDTGEKASYRIVPEALH